LNFSKLAAIAVVACGAAAAHAGPTDLGDGTGTYDFTGAHTHSFYVDLAPGTYSFSSTVSAFGGADVKDVWFSGSKDKSDKQSDDYSFKLGQDGAYSKDVASYTFTAPTRVFIDVKSNGSKGASGYNGTLTVAAVPEPATTALLLAGLGMIGFVGRRRSKG